MQPTASNYRHISMNQLRTFFFVLLAAASNITSVNASHIMGGDITYECVGTDSFFVTLNLFRDCSGISASNSAPVRFISSCGCFTQTFPLTNPGGTEISQLCPQELPNSTCNFGFLPGVKIYIYQGLVVLTPCADWNMNYDFCCKNFVQNLVQSDTWVEATMNSVNDDCNNSPVFTDFAVPYLCINQKVTYDFGVTEQDGDSLVFSLIGARGGSVDTCVITTINHTYYAPYSATNPIETGLVFDPTTGQMTFTPNALGKFVVVILVEEYDPITHQLLGSVMRETQFIVENCANLIPIDTAGIQNLASNTATQTGLYTLTICAGDSLAFDFCAYDLNVADSVFLSSNVTTTLQGATFTPVAGNPACAAISWTAPIHAGFHSFSITAKDNVCPIYGLNSFVFTIEVLTSTIANQDVTICRDDSTQLNVTGQGPFQWTVIVGDVNSLSCANCSNPISSPDSTTTYAVTGQAAAGCSNVDTVTVFVVQPTNPTIFPLGPFCDIDPPIALVADTNGGLWSGPGVAGNGFDPAVAGAGTHTITYIMPNQGCPDTATIQVVVNPCPSSITEHTTTHFRLYPNPTTGLLSVTSTSPIQVLNIFGQVVLQTTETELDLSAYPRGVYFIRTEEGTRKVVLK